MENNKRIYVIDYLKAICIMMVIFTHYSWADKKTPFFTLVIAMAVPIFMVLSGFNFSMSYDRKINSTLKEMYAPRLFFSRLRRFLFPFIVIFIAEIILHPIILNKHYSLRRMPFLFLRGGIGPGSYYTPTVLLMIIVFPLIYLCIRRLSGWGVAIMTMSHLLYEVLVVVLGMEKSTYRLVFFRYLVFVALGCYFYFHSKDRKRYPLTPLALCLMFLVGITYNITHYQFHVRLPIFIYWPKTAMPMAFYIFPIICVLVKKLGTKKLPEILHNFMSGIGRASYHIFLVQMVYFRLFDQLVLPGAHMVFRIAANFIICLSAGYGYFLLEGKLSKLLFEKRVANN